MTKDNKANQVKMVLLVQKVEPAQQVRRGLMDSREKEGTQVHLEGLDVTESQVREACQDRQGQLVLLEKMETKVTPVHPEKRDLRGPKERRYDKPII